MTTAPLHDPKPHKRLLAWQKCMDLFVEIHRMTNEFPHSDRYLVMQMRRAALSAPSNIAEGAAGQTLGQFRAFLSHAIASLNELETQLEASRRIGLVSEDQAGRVSSLVDECIRLAFGLRRSLRGSDSTGPKCAD